MPCLECCQLRIKIVVSRRERRLAGHNYHPTVRKKLVLLYGCFRGRSRPEDAGNYTLLVENWLTLATTNLGHAAFSRNAVRTSRPAAFFL
jgi:hypothetical protein